MIHVMVMCGHDSWDGRGPGRSGPAGSAVQPSIHGRVQSWAPNAAPRHEGAADPAASAGRGRSAPTHTTFVLILDHRMCPQSTIYSVINNPAGALQRLHGPGRPVRPSPPVPYPLSRIPCPVSPVPYPLSRIPCPVSPVPYRLLLIWPASLLASCLLPASPPVPVAASLPGA